MPATKLPTHTPATYLRAEREYQRVLPPEHYVEAFGQSTQRKITVESLDLVTASRSDVHAFSDLLVQYSWPEARRGIGQVCPDNLVVVHDGPIEVDGSYNLPWQPARPFWVLEYVSKHNARKDYEDNVRKYEQELKVPYYLLFRSEAGELTLFKLKRT